MSECWCKTAAVISSNHKCGEDKPVENTNNFIIGVAVRFGDICVALPKPNRHCHCFWEARRIGITSQSNRANDQGFYLEDGTFLNRVQAMEHALKVGQPFREKPTHALFSENLW